MNPKTYTFEELKEFILSRNDDKLVNMNQSAYYTVDDGDTYCGCVLVQFFRKKFKNTVRSVGYNSGTLLKNKKIHVIDIHNETDGTKTFNFIKRLITHDPKTYKEVKEILNQFS